jgi:RHS repeat-associated protein
MGQTLSLTKGQTYTLSGYIKANNVSNTNGKGACVFVNYQNSSGVWQTVDSKYINGTTTDWQRVEVTFTVPSDAASATVYARAGIVEESGDVNFDCLQLETGKIANRYNIVENSDLTYSQSGVPVSWSKNSYCDSNDTALSAIQNDPGVPGIDRCAFKINGAASKTKALYQTVNVSGSAGDVFTIGGWAKGASVPQDSNRYFALDIGLKKSDGTYQWKVIYFNQDTDNWQYISGKVIANTNYTSIYYYLIYYNNANTAYFDGLQLYKEDFDTSYTYDTNGNPISVKELAQKNSTYEFTNNEVSKMIEPSGGSFTYSHDDTTHNITGATTAEGVKYSFTYDSHGNPITATVGDVDPAPHLTTTAGYTTSGNYMSSLTDPSGHSTQYSYNETEGTLSSETDPNGHATSYAYDTMDNLSSVTKSVGGHDVTNSYIYENDDLKTITHNGFDFNFDYDHFGNVVSVSAAGTALSENTYDTSTGNLTSTTYGSGNGPRTSYLYDSLDRITSQNYQEYNETSGVYETKLTYNYGYDVNGNLGLVEDIANSVDYRYIYDLSDRIARIEDSNGNTTAFGYDDNSNGNSLSENISGTSYVTRYVYDKDNRIIEADIHDGSKVTYSYDTMGRLSTATITSGTYNQQTTYNYNNEKLQSIVLPGGRTISYTYDNNGNILTINDTGNNKEIEYKYNELDELIRENNQVTGKTVIYAYDDGGNIQSKTEYAYTTDADPQNPAATHTYTYDTTWKDKLASYDGQAITYDNAGNPTGYNGLTFAWQNGKQLKSITGNGLDISYKYNYDGIRTEKTVNGTTTKYHLVNGNVTYEITHETDDTYTIIYYTYDNSGNILSMNLNGTEYYYLKNAQGDIIGLTDSTGTQVVSYTYDSWGKLISIDGILKDTVGVKNPYRYRSYRYDTETGLYYLQSRYYNPEWGRFINNDSIAGSVGELLGHNIFAYCKNSPINMEDPTGHREIYEATLQEESSKERHASIASMNKHYHDNRALKKVVQNVKRLTYDVGSSLTSSGLDKLASPMVVQLNREMKRHKSKSICLPGSKIAKYTNYALTCVETGSQVYNDINSYGWTYDGIGRATIDIGITVIIYMSSDVLTPFGGVLLGVGLDYAGDYTKKQFFN